MSGDPRHPLPDPDSPGARSRGWEDQDEVLAPEIAAFPDDDEPLSWEELQYLEYLDDDGSAGYDPWPLGLPGEAEPDRAFGDCPAAAVPINVEGAATGPLTDAEDATAPNSATPGSTSPAIANSATPGPATASPATPDPTTPDPDPTSHTAANSATPDPATPDPATPGPTAAEESASVGAMFADGGAADVMLPGPVLAGLADRVWRDGLDKLGDDELTGVLQAAERLAARAAALKLSAVCAVVARREAEGRASGDWRPFDHVDDEIAMALTLTGGAPGTCWAWQWPWTGCR